MAPIRTTTRKGQGSNSSNPQKDAKSNKLSPYQACIECRARRLKCVRSRGLSSPCANCVDYDLPCTAQSRPSKPLELYRCAPCNDKGVRCDRNKENPAICKRCETLNRACRPQAKYLWQHSGSQSDSGMSQSRATSESANEINPASMLSESTTMSESDTFEAYEADSEPYFDGNRPSGNGLGLENMNFRPNTYTNPTVANQPFSPPTLGRMIGEDDVENSPGLTTAHQSTDSSPSARSPNESQPSLNGLGATDGAGEAVNSDWAAFANSLPFFDGYTPGDEFGREVEFLTPSKTSIVKEGEKFDFEDPLPEL